jgi:hypothetical protein
MNPKMFEDAERRYSKEEIAKCIYMAIKHGSVRHCSSEELIYETVEDIMRDGFNVEAKNLLIRETVDVEILEK